MARVAIFTDDPGWHGQQLKNAFAVRGMESEFVSLTECRLQSHIRNQPIFIPGFSNGLPVAVFVRGVPGGSLQEVVFYLDILHALKHCGVPVYNDAQMIERSVDKSMTSFLLHQANIASPETWVLGERNAAVHLADQQLTQGYRLVTKPVFGSQGEGLRLIEKKTDLFWLSANNGIFYIQKFIESQQTEYCDLRLFVINGQVVAAMQREGVCWLNNVARGAKCSSFTIDDTLGRLAIKTVATLKMDYAGIDIIVDKKGDYQVIEVNSIPAWKGLQSVCGLNIAQLLVDDLCRRYINRQYLDKAG